MNLDRFSKLTKSALVLCSLLVLATATGCLYQNHIAGQTMVEAGQPGGGGYYLDDGPYSHARPEFKLQNAIDRQEQYKAEQLSIREGLAE